ncbi:MAG: hypothetical protein HZC28_16000 [Spirochaetes bacterium]|nr:hypothetical protein [Spirochaetota bacterium]
MVILWGTRWRLNQKDVPLREAAAERGIERFFSTARCFSKYRIFRSIGGRPALDLSAAELHAFAATNIAASDRILSITVRELGPVVKLFSSLALIDGGTEVVLDISEIVPATGETAGSFIAHWQNGGPWVIKGVATLEDDIVSALREAMSPPGSK